MYSPEEAAEIMNLNPNTIRAWLRTGQLKGVKLGGRIWRISEEAIEDFIKNSAIKDEEE